MNRPTEGRRFTIPTLVKYILVVIKIAVEEIVANWSDIEAKVKNGESFEILNRGQMAAHLVPATPRKVLVWPDHLREGVSNTSTSGSEFVEELRGNRF